MTPTPNPPVPPQPEPQSELAKASMGGLCPTPSMIKEAMARVSAACKTPSFQARIANEDGASTDLVITAMANAFLSWPLPASVCADRCASDQTAKHRIGTNLLSFTEAKAMFEQIAQPHFIALCKENDLLRLLRRSEAQAKRERGDMLVEAEYKVARLTGELAKWLQWSENRCPDLSPGDVIAAEDDGSIILDDNIDTWNPLRALMFLSQRLASVERERDKARTELTHSNYRYRTVFLEAGKETELRRAVETDNLTLRDKLAAAERELAVAREKAIGAAAAWAALDRMAAICKYYGFTEGSIDDRFRAVVDKLEAKSKTDLTAQRDTAARAGMAEELIRFIGEGWETGDRLERARELTAKFAALPKGRL